MADEQPERGETPRQSLRLVQKRRLDSLAASTEPSPPIRTAARLLLRAEVVQPRRRPRTTGSSTSSFAMQNDCGILPSE
jgi:hypothetical protein